MTVVYIVETREDRAAGDEYVEVGDLDVFETREDAQRWLESQGFERQNLLDGDRPNILEGIEDGEGWENADGWAIIYPKTPRKVLAQQKVPSTFDLHSGALTYMSVTGSRGARYVVDRNGFEYSANVKRSEGVCSFCGIPGHDVGVAE